MSIIPSLSVWSSIKIRPPGYYNRNSNEAKSSVSYVNSWSRMKQKYNVRAAPEVVNLRVPSPLRKGTEYPDVLPVTPEIVRKASRLNSANHGLSKKAHNLGHLTVPHAPELYAGRNKDCGKDGAKHRHKPCCRPNGKEAYDDELTRNIYFDDKFPDPDSDDGMDVNCIPRVKPWTPGELRALSKRYNLMEDKANPATERKKNKRKVKTTRSEQKTPRKQSRIPCSDARKSRKSSRPNSSCNDFEPQSSLPVAKWKQAGRCHYETKLAELYMIQLGVKSRRSFYVKPPLE